MVLPDPSAAHQPKIEGLFESGDAKLAKPNSPSLTKLRSAVSVLRVSSIELRFVDKVSELVPIVVDLLRSSQTSPAGVVIHHPPTSLESRSHHLSSSKLRKPQIIPITPCPLMNKLKLFVR